MDNQYTFIKAPNAPVSDQELLDDLKRVSIELDNKKGSTRKCMGQF